MLIRFLFVILLLVSVAWAAPQGKPKLLLTQVSVTPPDTGGGPVEVTAGVFIESIDEINESKGTYGINCYLDLGWHDSRLAFDPKTARAKMKVYLEKNARLMLEKIWWPDVEFVNESQPWSAENEELIVASNGEVLYRGRVRATLHTKFELGKFPFDVQRLMLRVHSFAYGEDEMRFKIKQQAVEFSPEMRLSGWKVERVEEEVRSRQTPRDRVAFSEVDATVTLRRDPGFFVQKFLTPLIVVMLLICGVLWMPSDDIKDRVSATLTGMLTSAAYGFTVTQYLPGNVYSTFLDSVVLLSLLHSSLLMLENIVVFRLATTRRVKEAERLDHACMWIFPLGFLGMIVGQAFYFGIL